MEVMAHTSQWIKSKQLSIRFPWEGKDRDLLLPSLHAEKSKERREEN